MKIYYLHLIAKHVRLINDNRFVFIFKHYFLLFYKHVRNHDLYLNEYHLKLYFIALKPVLETRSIEITLKCYQIQTFLLLIFQQVKCAVFMICGYVNYSNGLTLPLVMSPIIL